MFHSEVICVYKSSVLASLLYIQAISLDQSLSVNARRLGLIIFTADLPESNASCSGFSSTDFAHKLIRWFPAAEKGNFVPTPLLSKPSRAPWFSGGQLNCNREESYDRGK